MNTKKLLINPAFEINNFCDPDAGEVWLRFSTVSACVSLFFWSDEFDQFAEGVRLLSTTYLQDQKYPFTRVRLLPDGWTYVSKLPCEYDLLFGKYIFEEFQQRIGEFRKNLLGVENE